MGPMIVVNVEVAMTAQRIFGVLFLCVGGLLLSMGIDPIRFAGHFAGVFADRTTDMATFFYLPGLLFVVIGCVLMLFGRGKEA
jgi:hypothetical protein